MRTKQWENIRKQKRKVARQRTWPAYSIALNGTMVTLRCKVCGHEKKHDCKYLWWAERMFKYWSLERSRGCDSKCPKCLKALYKKIDEEIGW
jgi:hypothetical protein